VTGAQAGETVVIAWQSLPERLEAEEDEPVFPESAADPMIYIALATAQVWISEYYRRLRAIRPDMRPARKRRMPRAIFR